MKHQGSDMALIQQTKGECLPPVYHTSTSTENTCGCFRNRLGKCIFFFVLTVEKPNMDSVQFVSVFNTDCCCLEWARMRSILARWWVSVCDPARVIGAVQQKTSG